MQEAVHTTTCHTPASFMAGNPMYLLLDCVKIILCYSDGFYEFTILFSCPDILRLFIFLQIYF